MCAKIRCGRLVVTSTVTKDSLQQYKLSLTTMDKDDLLFLPNSLAAFSATFSTFTIALELFRPILHKLSKVRDDLNGGKMEGGEEKRKNERRNEGVNE